MPDEKYLSVIRDRLLIRIDTLIRLRWYAIIGQAGAVLLVAFGFDYDMPWMICLFLVCVSALLNVYLTQRYRTNTRIANRSVFLILAFDIVQLFVLLFLTGGLQNPFAILLMAPVIVSASSLERDRTLLLGILSLSFITLLAFVHMPLPWNQSAPLLMPSRYVTGTWVAIVCTLSFTAIYAFRVAEEARRLADALSASELVLQREQHMSALDGLAAAAAHELGTPLATIALVAREMERSAEPDSPFAEDIALLRSQSRRCRDILQELTSLSTQDGPIFEDQSVFTIVEEVVQPLREFDVAIDVVNKGPAGKEPMLPRNRGMIYGLGNLVDNAVDFARERVTIEIDWDDDQLRLAILDDGKGFPTSLLANLGEPFISGRTKGDADENQGLGLGIFIARTLLERSGARIAFSNLRTASGARAGARVDVMWPRPAIATTVVEQEREPDGARAV